MSGSVVGCSSFVVRRISQSRGFVIPTAVRTSARGWSNEVEEPAFSRLRELASFIFICALLCCAASAQDLPQGWRRPKQSEISQPWRLKNKVRFLVIRADLDGDGRPDRAELLVTESRKQCALFVLFSGEYTHWGNPIWHSDLDGVGRYGINVAGPGRHSTLCSSDPSSCDPHTPTTVDLTSSGIYFFSYGEASSLAFWDKRDQNFHWVPMSD
jgi:hypothetical protein